MTKTVDTPRPFSIMMTDEEIEEYHETKKKEALLDELLKASNKSFSVKNLKKNNTEDDKKIPAPREKGSLADPLESSDGFNISDEDWDAILEKASHFNPPSPIDDITRSELGTFRLEDSVVEDPSSFNGLFKKEQSMLAELMKDVTEQARAANNKLKDMTKKSSGYGGVSKTYPDLLSAANSLNTTRLNIVKQMADLKKTIADLNFKKMKEEGPADGNNDNEIADGFFNKILGNRKEFIEASMNGLMGQSGTIPYPYNDLPPEGQLNENEIPYVPMSNNINLDEPPANHRPSRSITSPLMGYRGDYEEDEMEQSSGDPYGYIKNEDRDVTICVQRFQDGRVEFVAVDKDGDGVDGYELPADDLLLGLEFRIGSQFATDEEGRRYRIIDVDPSGVDISDILDDDE